METRNEKDQDHRTDLAGRRDPGAWRTGRRRRVRAWRMGDAVFRYGYRRGHRRGPGPELRSAAWPPHLRYLRRLLAEGREPPDGRRTEHGDEIRRDPPAGQPRMGSGRGPGR